MRGYPQLTQALAKSQLREPVTVFFLVVLAPALLAIMGLIFGNEPVAEFGGAGPLEAMTPGILLMSMLVLGAVAMPQQQAMLRTSGALARLRMTPLKPSTFVAADLTVSALIGIIGPVLTLLIAIFLFDVTPPANVSSLLGAVLLSLIALLAFGSALSSLRWPVGAVVGVGNMLMVVLMISSGAFIPVAGLDAGVRRAFAFSPSYQMVQLVRAAWEGTAWPMSAVVYVVCFFVICSCVAVLLRRKGQHF